MPKEKNQHKSAAASDEKFRDFFTTTVADIPAEMVRREEEAEEHKGLFGRLFGHAKPKQAPQAGTDLELPTGEVLLGADALAKPDGEEPLDLDLTLRTADPGTDFPQPKAEVPAAPEKPAVPDRPAPQPAPENKPEPPKAPAAPAPQPEAGISRQAALTTASRRIPPGVLWHVIGFVGIIVAPFPHSKPIRGCRKSGDSPPSHTEYNTSVLRGTTSGGVITKLYTFLSKIVPAVINSALFA